MNSKITGTLAVLLCLAVVAAAEKRAELPKVRVTAQVVDERGAAVAGATVKLVFGSAHNANEIVRVEGNTNPEGQFVGQGHSGGTFGASVSKAGYYLSGLSVPPLNDIINGKSQDVICRSVLRPIGNPLPLYAKRVQIEVPVVDQPCGFDLERGDWVVPHGKGKKNDFFITARSDYKDRYDFATEVRFSFTQPLDGFVQTKSPAIARNSVFRWDRLAPETGYVGSHFIRFQNHDPRSGRQPSMTFDLSDRERGYFFRIRTVEQGGRIVAANYGKIIGDIGIDPRETTTCLVTFTYHFNPTSLDRNLEWDAKRNLLSGLSPMESPREP